MIQIQVALVYQAVVKKFGLKMHLEQYIDSVDLVAVTDTAASYGRLPDGSANWQILVPRTRGFSNVVTGLEDEFNSISEYRLNQNYPNPFNPTTTISFTIPTTSNVSLKVLMFLEKKLLQLLMKQKVQEIIQ